MSGWWKELLYYYMSGWKLCVVLSFDSITIIISLIAIIYSI